MKKWCVAALAAGLFGMAPAQAQVPKAKQCSPEYVAMVKKQLDVLDSLTKEISTRGQKVCDIVAAASLMLQLPGASTCDELALQALTEVGKRSKLLYDALRTCEGI